MYDIVIAGAGPAGAVAATVLARAGARVLVVDRLRFPRHKLCGDTVNPGAVALLRRMGLDRAVRGGLPVDGMVVTGASGVAITGTYTGTRGMAIRRRVFDAALIEAARAAGASIEEGVLVLGPTVEWAEARPSVTGLAVRGRDGQSVRLSARIIIAADGRYSRVARALGLSHYARRPRRWAVGAYFQDVANLSSFGEMHVRDQHYLGVAPLPDGLANACLVSTACAALADPSSFLLTALRTDPQLADRFARARMVAPAVSLGPMAVDCGVAGVPGLLLAGDAAGFVDPMTGDGLRFAMRGGEQAAIAACRVLEDGWRDAHTTLLAARRREFAGKWRFNRALRRLVGSPTAIRAATYGATIWPGILREVICYAGDVGEAAEKRSP